MYEEVLKSYRKYRKNEEILEVKLIDIDSSIIDCNFSRHVLTCLLKCEILKVSDLVRCSADKLLTIRNFGESCLKEVLIFLQFNNLKLNMTEEEINEWKLAVQSDEDYEMIKSEADREELLTQQYDAVSDEEERLTARLKEIRVIKERLEEELKQTSHVKVYTK